MFVAQVTQHDYVAELGSSWMSSVTSVVTSSVMTSSIGTAGLRGVDAEEQRPHSQPAMPSSAFPSEPIVLDKSYPVSLLPTTLTFLKNLCCLYTELYTVR